ncbi:MAG: leucine-rich repeat protein, partial [Bacilli bacterium]|nr:leucine-rich repeat protein [Bacilli bacterium]
DAGTDGKEVTFQVSEGFIQWQYIGESAWTNLVELSTLIGPKGDAGTDGKEVTFQVSEGFIQWQYVGESTWTNLIEIATLIGKQGVGILETKINEFGELIVIYTDETQVNLGIPIVLYTVQFKDYNGNILDVQRVAFKQSATAPFDPTRTGYTFSGWSDDYSSITSDLIVFATYNENTYSVSFESNGGTAYETINNVSHDSIIILPIPEKEGYQFKGWYLNNNINASPFYEDSRITRNLILYARWEIKEHLVTFVNDDNSILFAQYIKHGTSIIAPSNPSKEGYTFIGWDKEFNQITNELIIRALYTINFYDVNFDVAGGHPIPSISASYQSLITLPSPTKESYVFLRWELEGTTFDELTPIINDITLLAVWTPYVEYQITFDTQGGDLLENQIVPTYSIVKSLPSPTKVDYVFDGWLLNDVLIETPFEYTYNQDITLVAKWKGLSDGIEFEIINSEAIILSYIGSETNIVIPDTIEGSPVTTIAANAFKNNQTLENIALGSYVATIGDYAFSNIVSLKSLVLPNQAKTIGVGILKDSNSFETLTLSSEAPYDLKYYFGNDINFVPTSFYKIKYANGGTFINNILFNEDMKGATLELATDLTSITNNQFEESVYLTSIIIPEGVTSIGFSAFIGCTSLTSITIPESVTIIGDGAFSFCTSLPSIMIPDGVTSIGGSVFDYCASLTSITIPKGVTSIGSSAFRNCLSLTSITIPEGVTSIGSFAFRNCLSLTSITIPEGVTSIGDAAFEGYKSLTIYVKATSKPAGWDTNWNYSNRPVVWGFTNIVDNNEFIYAFSSLNQATIIGLSSNNIDVNIIIPSTINSYEVVMITDTAFNKNQQIESIQLPNTITKILPSSFSYCPKLKAITFEENSQLEEILSHAFYDCTSLTSITIPEGVTSIGDSAFSLCTSLPSITIPESVTSIGNSAFIGCTSLTSITIPDGVTSIGRGALYNCTSLTSITIPESVTSIGDYAFGYCTSLTNFMIPESVTSIGNSAFGYCTSLTSVMIPESVTSIGDYAFSDCTSLTIYVKATSKLSGWSDDWNYSNRPVVWGYEG